MKRIIVGTAGHIDHGKTALVKALTGVDADRLREEKERGITIDIGFADLTLGETHFGFVDVPGHERFVKNMLAGAHGIDIVLLVVAADEGVMPQTREHFDICRLLSVKSGLIVITKADLADDELATLVEDEVADFVKGSFLDGAPVIRVSSRTGQGIAELKRVLEQLARSVPSRDAAAVARLPIDRIFTIKGFGTVVTGTLVAGTLSTGDELDIIPSSGLRTRARGLQVHSRAVDAARAGERTAVNVQGLEVSDLERGHVLVPAGRLQQTSIADARLELLPSAKRLLRTRTRVRFHCGTAEILARVILLDTTQLEPGKRTLAQLRFETPILVLPGDHFIIRSYSPSMTIGGGTILDAHARKHRKKDTTNAIEFLSRLETADELEQIALYVEAAGESGTSLAEIAMFTGHTDQVISRAAKELGQKGRVHITDENQVTLVSRAVFETLGRRMIELVKVAHQKSPLDRGISREELRARLGSSVRAETFRALIRDAVDRGQLVSERDLVRDSRHQVTLSADELAAKDQLAQIYAEAALETMTLDDAVSTIASRFGFGVQHAQRFAQMLFTSGELVRIADLVFHKSALDGLRTDLARFKRERGSHIDVAAFKDLTGVSRKYAIPLLEYLDRQRITRRNGDVREIL
jgi:selenocysteine-specific elongation factor